MQKPLEERIGSVLSNVKERLRQGAMREFDYGNLVFEQLKEQCILFGSDRQTPSYRWALEREISKNLDVKSLPGVRGGYVTLKSVPLSKVIREDVARFDKIKEELCSELKQEFGEIPIDSENFRVLVGAYVEERLPEYFSWTVGNNLQQATSSCVKVVETTA